MTLKSFLFGVFTLSVLTHFFSFVRYIFSFFIVYRILRHFTPKIPFLNGFM
jgi:hypothetical protein